MIEHDDFVKRAQEYRHRLDEASVRWGKVEICAATKNQDARTANFAYEAGVKTIGENRVQELLQKRSALNPDYKVHMIGRLQSNKVKYIVRHVDMIQSLDRDSLALEINRQAGKAGVVMPVLIQVNIAGETQKGGVSPEELVPFLRRVSSMEWIAVKGLMAVMPAANDPEDVRKYFRKMRIWFERLREHPIAGVSMDVLSMGMSHDCVVAAQEGATMVRLGTALFGGRPSQPR